MSTMILSIVSDLKSTESKVISHLANYIVSEMAICINFLNYIDMEDNKVLYITNREEVTNYKYVGVFIESQSYNSKLYVSNNLRALKKYILDSVRVAYPDASGNIYKSSDEYLQYSIWGCYRKGNKTYSRNIDF